MGLIQNHAKSPAATKGTKVVGPTNKPYIPRSAANRDNSLTRVQRNTQAATNIYSKGKENNQRSGVAARSPAKFVSANNNNNQKINTVIEENLRAS